MFKKIRPHSIELFDTILLSSELMNSDAKQRIAAFISSQFTHEGGFCNRAGKVDQYYTMFGLGCAAALHISLPSGRIKKYLSSFTVGQLDLVHLVCWAKSILILKLMRWRKCYRLFRLIYCWNLRRSLNTDPGVFRTSDGGFSENADDNGQSHPYANFMGVNLYQDSAIKMDNVEKLIADLEHCRTADGAFHNPHGGGRGMLLSTSAAMLALRQLTGEVDPKAVEWMSKQQGETGGFHASPDTPMPDLLSTAVALFSLHVCGYPLDEMADSARGFILDHWHENGGFTGTLVDDCADCEYTFYALMALGALAK